MIKNETIDVLLTRRSIKAFKPEQIKNEELETILAAGVNAPTGRNLQAPIIVAVQDPETVKLLSRLNAKVMGASGDPFYGAPTVLVVLADKSKAPTYLYDGSLVMGNLMNAAHAIGVGSCWIHRAKEVFESSEGKALLAKWGIEGDYEGIGNCVLGYNAREYPAPKEHKADYVYYVK